MGLARLLVDLGTLQADCGCSTAVTLMGRDELDAAVAVPVVVPIHKSCHPLTSLRLAVERPAWVIRPVLGRAEQGFRVGIVVAHSWPGEGAQYTQLFQP